MPGSVVVSPPQQRSDNANIKQPGQRTRPRDSLRDANECVGSSVKIALPGQETHFGQQFAIGLGEPFLHPGRL